MLIMVNINYITNEFGVRIKSIHYWLKLSVIYTLILDIEMMSKIISTNIINFSSLTTY